MRFYIYSQHLQQVADPPHCQTAGRWDTVRDLQAALVKANRWDINRDAFLTPDGVMLVNHHTWTWYDVTVRSRIIESFSFVGLEGSACLPDPQHFKNKIVPTLNGSTELSLKAKRFEAISRPFNGNFCEFYEPSRRHITSCPHCSLQFTRYIEDDYNLNVLKKKELNRQGMKQRRAEHGHERTKTGPSLRREGSKFRYAFAMFADDVE